MVAMPDMDSGRAITFEISGFPRSTPSVPANTSMSMLASGHAALIDPATGVASNTSPIRRMQMTRTRRMSVTVESLLGAHACGFQHLVEAAAILLELRAVALAM